MKDGMIKPDSPEAKELGFTADLFWGYLWKVGSTIVISFIESKKPNQGNLSRLIDTILAKEYNCEVPTPFPKMQSILEKKGFQQTFVFDNYYDCNIEVWRKNWL